MKKKGISFLNFGSDIFQEILHTSKSPLLLKSSMNCRAVVPLQISSIIKEFRSIFTKYTAGTSIPI